ncbi:MAG: phage holin family protein, partial [Chitinophagaceae bacterium]
MEDIKEKTIDLADHVEDLADTFYKLTVLNATQKASNIAPSAVVMLVVCSLGFFILLFSGLALAWWLGNIINNRAAGFLLAAALYLIILLFVSFFKKK